MKKKLYISPSQREIWLQEIATIQRRLMHLQIPLNRKNLLLESEVCELLGITSRTLNTYKREGIIHCIKLKGQAYYIKHILYNELLMHYG